MLSYSVTSEKTARANFPGCFGGVKYLHTIQHKFCGFVTGIKDTFFKKKKPKLANSVHVKVRNNLQTAKQGCHCQLDDQCIGPSAKEKREKSSWVLLTIVEGKVKSFQVSKVGA